MKITFNLNSYDQDFSWHLFKTKEEYDAHPYSQAGYNRWHAQPWGTRRGPCTRFMYEPHKFPCILIEGWQWDNPNGPYEIATTYIYDFTIEEDMVKETPACANCGDEGRVRDFRRDGEDAEWINCPTCGGSK